MSGSQSENDWLASLSEEEKKEYSRQFKEVASENIVFKETGQDLFKKSQLSDEILDKIWRTVDRGRKDFLEEKEFYHALMLIDQYKAMPEPEKPVSSSVSSSAIPNPFTPPAYLSSPVQMPRPAVVSSPNSAAVRMGVAGDLGLSPDERERYANMFENLPTVDGRIQGLVAKDIFVKSNLGEVLLSRVWDLADTEQRGTLSRTEFIVAMYYITQMCTGKLPPASLPQTIPIEVFQAAAGKQTTQSWLGPSSSLARGTSYRSPNELGGVVRHATGPAAIGGAPQRAASLPPPTAQEPPRKYDEYFEKLQENGYVDAEAGAAFFRHAKLPDSDLSQIWALADQTNRGCLTRDEFSYAMQLIFDLKEGKPLPAPTPAPSFYTPSQPILDLLDLNTPTTSTSTALALHQAPTQEKEDVAQLQAQFQAEDKAVQNLRAQVTEERKVLDGQRHDWEQMEKGLQDLRKEKERLEQELQQIRQDQQHYRTRLEEGRAMTDHLQKDIQTMTAQKRDLTARQGEDPLKSPRSTASVGGNLFSLSEPSHELFASVAKQDTGGSVGFSPVSGSSSLSRQTPRTLNEMKKERHNMASPVWSPTEIESKFPDMSSIERTFAAKESLSSTSSPVLKKATADESTGRPYPSTTSTLSPTSQGSSRSPFSFARMESALSEASTTVDSRAATSAGPSQGYHHVGWDMDPFPTSPPTSTSKPAVDDLFSSFINKS